MSTPATDRSATNDTKPRPLLSAVGDRRFTLVVAGVLVLGFAARILGAWLYRHSYNPDYGIVALMAKHMSEGRDFPIFFYGQYYMGSLEPAVSALVCSILGFSGFAVTLGTALCGFLLLPVVYLWGRDAAGRTAGLAALAFCVIGPDGYYHYESSPRGGYAVTLLTTALILWLTGRFVQRERHGHPVPSSGYFLIGLLGGLGLWSNFLIVPALLAAGLLIVCNLRTRVFRWRIFAAVPGGLVGALPLWTWNVSHHWGSLAMSRSFGSITQRFTVGLRLFWGARGAALLDVDRTPLLWRILLVAAVLAILVLSALAVLVPLRRSGLRNRISAAAAWVFLLVFMCVFSVSSFSAFNTPRYLLPLVPAFAVMAGIAMTYAARYVHPVAAAVPVALLLVWQVWTMPNHFLRAGKYETVARQARRMGSFMAERGLSAVYTPYLYHGLNYLLGEQYAFADLKGERYRPLARAVERADTVGVLNNYGGVSEFLAASGGSAKFGRFGLLRMHCDMTPPSPARLVPSDAWESARNCISNDVGQVLSDHDLDTSVDNCRPAKSPEWIRIELKEPIDVCGVALLSGDDLYPAAWRIEGRARRTDAWRRLTDDLRTSSFFWSGPRVYWAGEQFRLQSRFEPTTLREIRIWMGKDVSAGGFCIAEVRLFEPADDASQPAGADPVPELVGLLRERNVKRFYADRWLANRVNERSAGRIECNLEPTIFDQPVGGAARRHIRFGADTAIGVDRGLAGPLRQCLSAWGITMRETAVGPWLLFDFGPGDWRDEYCEVPGILFRGGSGVQGNRKHRAALLVKRAVMLLDASGDNIRAAVGLLRRAREVYPRYVPALQHLSRCLAQLGRTEEAVELEESVRRMQQPEIAAPMTFTHNIRFVGASLSPRRVAPGDTLSLCYFWRCPQDVNKDAIAAFVHFIGPGYRFQDDHVFLQSSDISYQPFPEVFLEERHVTVPVDAPPGEYIVRLGLYSRIPPARRFRVKTDLDQSRSAVLLPVSIEVVPE